jgi:hypothetical protein
LRCDYNKAYYCKRLQQPGECSVDVEQRAAVLDNVAGRKSWGNRGTVAADHDPHRIVLRRVFADTLD